jgi:cytochrome P450
MASKPCRDWSGPRPELIADPYPFYHRLRDNDPVHCSPLGLYVLSRHADVSSVLRDKRFGKDFVGQVTQRHGAQILDEPVYRSMRHWMLTQNPPDHTRLRGLVVQAFTARRVEEMRPRIQQIVDISLDRIAPWGHADLIADFAFRLPPASRPRSRSQPCCAVFPTLRSIVPSAPSGARVLSYAA